MKRYDFYFGDIGKEPLVSMTQYSCHANKLFEAVAKLAKDYPDRLSEVAAVRIYEDGAFVQEIKDVGGTITAHITKRSGAVWAGNVGGR